MIPEGGTVQTILSVIFPLYAALHVAWSVIFTIASSRLGLMSPICKTTNICCSFIDHTVRNSFSSISKEDVPTWCKEFYYDFILINGFYMFRTFTCPSSGVLIYRLFHCRMWCYALGVVAVVLRSWCVVLCTVRQYPTVNVRNM